MLGEGLGATARPVPLPLHHHTQPSALSYLSFPPFLPAPPPPPNSPTRPSTRTPRRSSRARATPTVPTCSCTLRAPTPRPCTTWSWPSRATDRWCVGGGREQECVCLCMHYKHIRMEVSCVLPSPVLSNTHARPHNHTITCTRPPFTYSLVPRPPNPVHPIPHPHPHPHPQSIIKYAPVDFSAWGGVWTPCAGEAPPLQAPVPLLLFLPRSRPLGPPLPSCPSSPPPSLTCPPTASPPHRLPRTGSLSPWGTHLGSEEYEPDARAFFASNSPASRVREFARYWGLYPGDFNSSAAYMTALRQTMNPYM